jgi:adenosylmethionine-8-amino-7-oxononanoate aminotransferase
VQGWKGDHLVSRAEAAIRDHLWLHESSREDLYEHGMLRVFERGEGCWLEEANGQRYFDLCSSMWQAALGHGRTEIVDAYAAQARKVASAGPIMFTTEGAAELAERLARVAPGDLSRCFLTSSGSEATETAIKLARHYHRLRGEPHRYKFISRYGSYHGAGVGGTSVSGRRRRDHLYYPLLPGTINVTPPNGENDEEAAEAIRTAIEMEGPETVAAVFGEPVAIMQFAIPGLQYWRRVREICDEYGVLLITDETLTGCCRTGRWWGIQHWDVVPDVLITAKALSGGYAPVAAMIVRERLFQEFGDDVPSPSVQSYGGHGASAAAAAKALEIYESQHMDEVAESLGEKLEVRLNAYWQHELVRDIRRLGAWVAIELQDPVTGASLAQGLRGKWSVAPQLSRLLLGLGCAAARMSEGIIHIAPPLVASDDDLDFVADVVGESLDVLATRLT